MQRIIPFFSIAILCLANVAIPSKSMAQQLNTGELLNDTILLLDNLSDTISFSEPDTIAVVPELTHEEMVDNQLQLPISKLDSLLYLANPLSLPLILSEYEMKPIWDEDLNYAEMLYPRTKSVADVEEPKPYSLEDIVTDLRADAKKYIASHAAHLYVATVDDLPDVNTFKTRSINAKRVKKINVLDENIDLGEYSSSYEFEKLKLMYWQNRVTTQLQFTQNYVSPNWHQGGQNSLAFLGILIAEANYDSRKHVQWDNKLEWRSGFNSVEGDTLRKVNTMDDVLRLYSKFGVKAGGSKWYYSLSGDFSTHLYNNYKGLNSSELKARLFTPVRINIGLGMDYKYDKIFSVMIAPITFKYIYLADSVNIDPNQFGIEKGKNQLKQLGSSLVAQLDYSPAYNWNISSKLKFYTDYSNIEADWEIVNDFAINRFLSTRVMLNPRYDNTVISQEGEITKIQFKELVSVGFTFRFL